MNLRKALFVAAILDYDQRRRNYDEFRERLESHISRWESSISHLEDSLQRTIQNINENQERRLKSVNFLQRLDSEKSKEWIIRQENIYLTNKNPKQRDEAKRKISEHCEKISSSKKQIDRIEKWISEGRDREISIREKISDLEYKISDARYKL